LPATSSSPTGLRASATTCGLAVKRSRPRSPAAHPVPRGVFEAVPHRRKRHRLRLASPVSDYQRVDRPNFPGGPCCVLGVVWVPNNLLGAWTRPSLAGTAKSASGRELGDNSARSLPPSQVRVPSGSDPLPPPALAPPPRTRPPTTPTKTPNDSTGLPPHDSATARPPRLHRDRSAPRPRVPAASRKARRLPQPCPRYTLRDLLGCRPSPWRSRHWPCSPYCPRPGRGPWVGGSSTPGCATADDHNVPGVTSPAALPVAKAGPMKGAGNR